MSWPVSLQLAPCTGPPGPALWRRNRGLSRVLRHHREIRAHSEAGPCDFASVSVAPCGTHGPLWNVSHQIVFFFEPRFPLSWMPRKMFL